MKGVQTIGRIKGDPHVYASWDRFLVQEEGQQVAHCDLTRGDQGAALDQDEHLDRHVHQLQEERLQVRVY